MPRAAEPLSTCFVAPSVLFRFFSADGALLLEEPREPEQVAEQELHPPGVPRQPEDPRQPEGVQSVPELRRRRQHADQG